MYDLYFLIGYNNYYNRRLKKHNSLQEYLTHIQDHYIKLEGCLNFNPADGVNTTHVLNDLTHYNVLADTPNYMLVVDPTNNQVLQRWFVIDCDRTRGGQYQCTLHRDILVDAYNSWTQSPVFVEKAILKNSDSGIFNRENMSFSQIKKKADVLLKDATGIPWLVGYGNFNKLDEKRVTFGTTGNVPKPNLTINTPITQWVYYGYKNSPEYEAIGLNQLYMYTHNDNELVGIRFKYNRDTLYIKMEESTGWYNTYKDITKSNIYTEETVYDESNFMQLQGYKLLQNFTDQRRTSLDNYIKQTRTSDREILDAIKTQDGMIVKDSLNDIYRVSLAKKEVVSAPVTPNNLEYSTLMYLLDGVKGIGNQTVTNTCAQLTYNEYAYTLQIDKWDTVSSYVDFTDIKELSDAPYSMIFMPYGDFRAKLNGSTYYQNAVSSLNLFTAISQSLNGAGFSYDLQLLPYCPLQNSNVIKHDGAGKYIDCNLINYKPIYDASNNIVGVMYVAEKSSASFTINEDISSSTYSWKVDYETTFYRLNSPSGNSSFQFSSQMNGDVDGFDVQFTYKPYSPYIHIAPRFKNMYGLNQPGDQRGLICTGNFSLTQITDAWETYQLQNINYQNIFDREVESLEFQRDVSIGSDIVSGVAGAFSTGVNAGVFAGPAAGIVAGVGSAAGGMLDAGINYALRNEALDLKNDMFGYQLGNIQALPNTISKLSGFNIISRYFPYLEFYESTYEERQALANKITYNGMTVMRIDKPINFFSNKFYPNSTSYNTHNYFKGQLIQCDIASEDFHFINAMADELNKGVYIPLGGI